MHVRMLLTGIVLMGVGAMVCALPWVIAEDPESHLDQIDSDDPDLQGRSWWVEGEVVLVYEVGDIGETLWLVWIAGSESGFNGVDCSDFRDVCFSAVSRSEMTQGDSGVYYIQFENKSSDCARRGYHGDPYDCVDGPAFWITMGPKAVGAVFYGIGGLVILVGMVMLYFSDEGGERAAQEPDAVLKEGYGKPPIIERPK